MHPSTEKPWSEHSYGLVLNEEILPEASELDIEATGGTTLLTADIVLMKPEIDVSVNGVTQNGTSTSHDVKIALSGGG